MHFWKWLGAGFACTLGALLCFAAVAVLFFFTGTSAVVTSTVMKAAASREGQAPKLRAAQAQVNLFGAALDTFHLDVGRYPTDQEGLHALRERPAGLARWEGPYLQKPLAPDPWGIAYVYRSVAADQRPEVLSYGADEVPGGEGAGADIGQTLWR
jgi:type II secretion system protein G